MILDTSIIHVVSLYAHPYVTKWPAGVEDFVSKSPENRCFRLHTVVWCFVSKELLRIFAYTLYCQKLKSLCYIFAADSMGLPSLKFPQWAAKMRVF